MYEVQYYIYKEAARARGLFIALCIHSTGTTRLRHIIISSAQLGPAEKKEIFKIVLSPLALKRSNRRRQS